jgi:hypothetical protein
VRGLCRLQTMHNYMLAVNAGVSGLEERGQKATEATLCPEADMCDAWQQCEQPAQSVNCCATCRGDCPSQCVLQFVRQAAGWLLAPLNALERTACACASRLLRQPTHGGVARILWRSSPLRQATIVVARGLSQPQCSQGLLRLAALACSPPSSAPVLGTCAEQTIVGVQVKSLRTHGLRACLGNWR